MEVRRHIKIRKEIVDVNKLRSECIIHSQRCVMYERWIRDRVMSYDIFKIEDDIIDENSWVNYPHMKCFLSPFHSAKRIYVRIGLPQEQAKMDALRTFFDYNKPDLKIPF